MAAPKDWGDRGREGTAPLDPGDESVPIERKRLPRLTSALEAGRALMINGMPKNPLRTGFVDIDDRVPVLGLKEVTMLAADSGVGKSTIAAQIVLHAAMCGHGAVYFNLEMPAEKFGLRTAAGYVGVPMRRAATGRLHDAEKETMNSGFDDLSPISDRIILGNQRDHRDPKALLDFARAAKVELDAELGTAADPCGLKLVVVDHVLKVNTKARNDKDAEGKERADLMKLLAETLNAHVFALVHITREAGKGGKMPTKNDLASSAWFDRDADNILIFHQKRNADQTFVQGPATLACQKSRWGEPFAIELEYRAGFFYPWKLRPEPPRPPREESDGDE